MTALLHPAPSGTARVIRLFTRAELNEMANKADLFAELPCSDEWEEAYRVFAEAARQLHQLTLRSAQNAAKSA